MSLISFIVFKSSFRGSPNVFKSQIYEYNEGYGYSISYGNKIIIKQNIIPVIPANKPFYDFYDAQKVADLVKEKLDKNESPHISLEELKELNIQLE